MTFPILLITFLGGVIGVLAGTTFSFIIYGLSNLIALSLGHHLGIDSYQPMIVNILLVPCVCFAGSVAGDAYKKSIKEYTSSSPVMYIKCGLISGAFGIFGYILYLGIHQLKLPLDAGALSIVISAIIVRKWITRQSAISLDYTESFPRDLLKNWEIKLLLPALLSAVIFFIVRNTGYVTLCFFISAASLVMLKANPKFPITHHISLVVGYAASAHLGFFPCIFLGLLSNIAFEWFNMIMNKRKKEERLLTISHFDSPAVTIALFSLIIYLL